MPVPRKPTTSPRGTLHWESWNVATFSSQQCSLGSPLGGAERLGKPGARFTLSEDITAAIPPGDENLYAMALELAAGFRPLTARERGQLLAAAKGIEPIFRA